MAALLLPVSGPAAAIGLGLQRATALAQSASNEKARIRTFDTGAGADKAARQAARQRPAIVLGPLYAGEVQAVAAALPADVPVVAFSNNLAARDARTFEFGITPSQSVSAVLQYAQARGARRIALRGPAGGWSGKAGAAARRLAPEIGLEIVELEAGPDAILLTGGSAQLAAEAQALKATGAQLLGTIQLLHQPGPLSAVDGIWFSAPDPEQFERLASAYGNADGARAGVIAALAYDAAAIVQSLAAAGRLSREGLLGSSFPGIAGAVRFRPDGRCVRELAVVTAAAGRLRTLDRKAGL